MTGPAGTETASTRRAVRVGVTLHIIGGAPVGVEPVVGVLLPGDQILIFIGLARMLPLADQIMHTFRER